MALVQYGAAPRVLISLLNSTDSVEAQQAIRSLSTISRAPEKQSSLFSAFDFVVDSILLSPEIRQDVPKAVVVLMDKDFDESNVEMENKLNSLEDKGVNIFSLEMETLESEETAATIRDQLCSLEVTTTASPESKLKSLLTLYSYLLVTRIEKKCFSTLNIVRKS